MPADTQQIKDRLDIVQIIGEYLPLKKSGANYKTNCPFHHEKTPSFMVHPEKQIWHCFGCSKGGDIFSFVQEMEGMDFVEALKLLADRAGVKIDTYQSEINSSQRNRIFEINSKAANFFNRFLVDIPAAKPARDYLERRGIKSTTIAEWQIGFAPDQWELLTQYLLKKGYGIDDIVASGLTIRRDNADIATGRGFYDRFRGRVMFPISDAHGNIVGFTGRVLVETENSGGKYVNTPQTIVYDKSRVLYGLNLAKTEIKTLDSAVLVEGQMDVVACHEAGMKNVVAVSGTALTPEQVRLLKRYTLNLSMAFDADSAGQSAGARGSEVALAEGMNVKVIRIPEGAGKDADECIRKNPAVWTKAVAGATSLMDWHFTRAMQNLGVDPKSRQKAADYLLAQIFRVPYAVEREVYLKRLSEELGVEIAVLRDEMKKIKTPTGGLSVASQTVVSKINPPPTKTKQDYLSEELWSILLKFPEEYSALRYSLGPELFVEGIVSTLYENAEKVYNTNQKLDLNALRVFYATEAQNPIDLLALRPYRNMDELDGVSARHELNILLETLRSEWKKKSRQEIQHDIAVAERSGNTALVGELLIKLQKLNV